MASRFMKEISEKSPEISDYGDYETITRIKNALKVDKICLIIF